MSNCDPHSLLISQQLGTAYANVKIVAENITALLALSAQLTATANVLDLLRGTTSTIISGEISADTDNSYIAVAPESGLVDDLVTIAGPNDGRVIVFRPELPTQTITLKAPVTAAITLIDPVLNELTVAAHGMVTGQQINLTGALPSGITAGVYWAIVVDADKFKIATSKANALAGTAVDLTEAGGGTLNKGNINITGDLVITGTESVLLVRDGLTYQVLTTTGISPSVDTAIDAVAAASQPLDPVLTSIADLILSGQAGNLIRIDATGTGFEVVDDEAYLNAAHSHAIADVTDLQTTLDGKAAAAHNHDAAYSALGHNHDASYATAGHNHDATYQKKITVSTLDPSGGAHNDVWFKVV